MDLNWSCYHPTSKKQETLRAQATFPCFSAFSVVKRKRKQIYLIYLNTEDTKGTEIAPCGAKCFLESKLSQKINFRVFPRFPWSNKKIYWVNLFPICFLKLTLAQASPFVSFRLFCGQINILFSELNFLVIVNNFLENSPSRKRAFPFLPSFQYSKKKRKKLRN